MFGYVRPLTGELRVRENEMFRAVYCGLCRAMGRHTGCASRMTLSYDFVFLCVIRAALTKTCFVPEPHRCAVHPLRARPMAQDCAVFSYCAKAAALLTYAKVQDDIRDERGARRTASRALRPAAAAMRRRAADMPELEETISGALAGLAAMEAENAPSIDEPAQCFGHLLGSIFAFGLTGTPQRIAREAGGAVGRFIYVTDAADDAAEDDARGRYNPITALYGRDIFETREYTGRDGRITKRPRLRAELAEKLYTAALCELNQLENAVNLIDFSGVQPEVEGILKNTAFLGMPAELRRVLALP